MFTILTIICWSVVFTASMAAYMIHHQEKEDHRQILYRFASFFISDKIVVPDCRRHCSKAWYKEVERLILDLSDHEFNELLGEGRCGTGKPRFPHDEVRYWRFRKKYRNQQEWSPIY